MHTCVARLPCARMQLQLQEGGWSWTVLELTPTLYHAQQQLHRVARVEPDHAASDLGAGGCGCGWWGGWVRQCALRQRRKPRAQLAEQNRAATSNSSHFERQPLRATTAGKGEHWRRMHSDDSTWKKSRERAANGALGMQLAFLCTKPPSLCQPLP
jgi:hypothetical protein